MKIYTKTGDKGDTSLYGGTRVKKDHFRIQAYGTLDELNSYLGLAVSINKTSELSRELTRIQAEIFELGAELATPADKIKKNIGITEAHVGELELAIDRMQAALEPLKTFILPGGSELAAILHIARTIARRAEREIITLSKTDEVRDLVIQYVNRLSDYLFVVARSANRLAGVPDTPWHPSLPSGS